jgi:hypothetical protein
MDQSNPTGQATVQQPLPVLAGALPFDSVVIPVTRGSGVIPLDVVIARNRAASTLATGSSGQSAGLQSSPGTKKTPLGKLGGARTRTETSSHNVPAFVHLGKLDSRSPKHGANLAYNVASDARTVPAGSDGAGSEGLGADAFWGGSNYSDNLEPEPQNTETSKGSGAGGTRATGDYVPHHYASQAVMQVLEGLPLEELSMHLFPDVGPQGFRSSPADPEPTEAVPKEAIPEPTSAMPNQELFDARAASQVATERYGGVPQQADADPAGPGSSTLPVEGSDVPSAQTAPISSPLFEPASRTPDLVGVDAPLNAVTESVSGVDGSLLNEARPEAETPEEGLEKEATLERIRDSEGIEPGTAAPTAASHASGPQSSQPVRWPGLLAQIPGKTPGADVWSYSAGGAPMTQRSAEETERALQETADAVGTQVTGSDGQAVP